MIKINNKLIKNPQKIKLDVEISVCYHKNVSIELDLDDFEIDEDGYYVLTDMDIAAWEKIQEMNIIKENETLHIEDLNIEEESIQNFDWVQ